MKAIINDPWTVLALIAMGLFSACQPNSGKVTRAQIQEKDHMSTNESYWVYISSGTNDGAGIGIYQWSPETGDLVPVDELAEVTSSSYLALNQEQEILYSTNGDGIQAFKINTQTGSLSLLNQVEHSGRGACYVSVSNDGRFLLVAYYGSGSAASYKLNQDRSIGAKVSVVQHQGSSVNQERQEGPHAHMILPAPVGNLVFVPDLGIDKVMAYQISSEGVLSPAPVPSVSLDAGYGPRHMAFHSNNRFAYVLAELTGNVVGFTFDPEKGLQAKINDLSTLPPDFTEFSKSADIHITRDGKYLYASNRGHNSLAIYAIDPRTGELSLIDILPCGGDWPRAFGIDPSGKFILVANKRSDAISVLEIDPDTGLFEMSENVKTVGQPQCIRFLKKE